MMHDKREAFDTSDTLLTAKETAELLRMDVASLANMRARGDGLPWVKLPSGGVRYRLSEVLAWVNGGGAGLTWARLANALEAYDGLAPAERTKLLEHLRTALKDG